MAATLWAQQPAAPQPAAQAAPAPMVKNLRVIVLAGDGEFNEIEPKLMAPVVVEVRDAEDRILEGANVVFRFPPSGPGAMFAGGKLSQTQRTNAQGQAAATGWSANTQTGPFQVRVTASYGYQIGEAVVHMQNVARLTPELQKQMEKEQAKRQGKKSIWSNKWVKIGIVAGAAAGVGLGIWATRDDGSSSSRPTVTINTGGVTIGAPQ